MKRRVRHLAKKYGIKAENLLVKLQACGIGVSNVNDQIPQRFFETAIALISPRTSGTSTSARKSLAHDGITTGFNREDEWALSGLSTAIAPTYSPQTAQKTQKSKKDGLQRQIHYLDKEELIQIHNALVAMFVELNDPIFPPGPKDEGLLDSAAHRPETSLGTTEKYTTIHAKAAALFHSLVKNHPFHNGNKRTALAALIVFLDDNGIALQVSDNELFDFVIEMATSTHEVGDSQYADKEVKYIETWLREHTAQVTEQVHEMKVRDFLESVKKAGGRYRESGRGGSWTVWGPNSDSINISKGSTKLPGKVVRRYLRNLGLSQGRTGIPFDEFEAGLDPTQKLIRKFREVLCKLSHA